MKKCCSLPSYVPFCFGLVFFFSLKKHNQIVGGTLMYIMYINGIYQPT